MQEDQEVKAIHPHVPSKFAISLDYEKFSLKKASKITYQSWINFLPTYSWRILKMPGNEPDLYNDTEERNISSAGSLELSPVPSREIHSLYEPGPPFL